MAAPQGRAKFLFSLEANHKNLPSPLQTILARSQNKRPMAPKVSRKKRGR